MFKLVGKETFNVGSAATKATINIDAVSGFAYEYTLEINGKSLKTYMENRSKVTNTWLLNLDGIDCRVVLGKICALCVHFLSPAFIANIQCVNHYKGKLILNTACLFEPLRFIYKLPKIAVAIFVFCGCLQSTSHKI